MKNMIPLIRRPVEEECIKCGSHAFHHKTVSDTIDFKGLTLDVEGLEFTYCDICHFRWETLDQASRNEQLIKKAYAEERNMLRARDGLLTGNEIAHIRKDFSLTQREAAALLGGGANAFNKYESGEVLQSVAMDRLIRLLSFNGTPALAFLEKLTQAVRPGFELSYSVKQPSKILRSINLIIDADGQSSNLRINDVKTAEQVLSAISNSTFEEIVPNPELLLNNPVYVPMSSKPSTVLFFREIK